MLTHLLGGDESFYPYPISQSCRFNNDDSAYTSRAAPARAPWSNGVSFWVKRCTLGATQYIISSDQDASNRADLFFNSSDKFAIYGRTGGADYCYYTTDMVFRDTSSWYHILVVTTGNEAVEADKLSIYVNGTELKAGSGLTATTAWTTSVTWNILKWATSIGRYQHGASGYLDAYLAEFHVIDGVRPTVGNFGETKNGVWVPVSSSGSSYANSAFYLDFSNSSDFGEDQSGLNNDFTDSGLAAVDQVEDSPTNNYPTLNVLDVTDTTFVPSDCSDGNLKYTASQSSTDWFYSTFKELPSSGKWYFEMEVDAGITASDGNRIGLEDVAQYTALGNKVVDGGAAVAYGDAWANNDIIGVACNCDDGEITFYVDNVSQGTLSPTNSVANATIQGRSTDIGVTYILDFGQSGFTYTPPNGYKALNSKNLPTLRGVTDGYLEGSKGFDVLTWSGDDTSPRNITGLNFNPNLGIVKSRTGARSHFVQSDSLPAGYNLQTNNNVAEFDASGTSNGGVEDLITGGIQVIAGGVDADNVNKSGQTGKKILLMDLILSATLALEWLIPRVIISESYLR
jgi:hypothetical protein